MIKKDKRKTNKIQTKSVFQYVLNISLVLLAIILCVLLGKEIYLLFKAVLFSDGKEVYYIFLERILMFFLYFEFIVMIVKYFQENYHFSINYFLYIGITALLRLVVVHHEDPVHTFWYTLSILVLIVGFRIMNFNIQEKNKRG